MIGNAEIIDVSDTSEADDFPVPSQVAEFYKIQVSDNDILDAAEILEDVVPGLGDWYLGVDPDCEIQRDLLALGRLFWEHRKGPCKCACTRSAQPETSTPILYRQGKISHGKAQLTNYRLSRGLSQRQLAKLINSTQATISRLENGAIIHTDYIRKHIRSGLERVFQVPMDQLLLVKTKGESTTTK